MTRVFSANPRRFRRDLRRRGVARQGCSSRATRSCENLLQGSGRASTRASGAQLPKPERQKLHGRSARVNGRRAVWPPPARARRAPLMPAMYRARTARQTCSTPPPEFLCEKDAPYRCRWAVRRQSATVARPSCARWRKQGVKVQAARRATTAAMACDLSWPVPNAWRRTPALARAA